MIMYEGTGALLLVEDDPADAEFALRVIRDTIPSVKFIVAKNGDEALKHLFPAAARGENVQHTIKAVMLDLHLPGIDGFEILKRIKSDAALRSIPVVVLSSSREEKDIDRCYELGANSYAVKPIDAEQYEKVVGAIATFWLNINETPAQQFSPFAVH